MRKRADRREPNKKFEEGDQNMISHGRHYMKAERAFV